MTVVAELDTGAEACCGASTPIIQPVLIEPPVLGVAPLSWPELIEPAELALARR